MVQAKIVDFDDACYPSNACQAERAAAASGSQSLQGKAECNTGFGWGGGGLSMTNCKSN